MQVKLLYIIYISYIVLKIMTILTETKQSINLFDGYIMSHNRRQKRKVVYTGAAEEWNVGIME